MEDDGQQPLHLLRTRLQVRDPTNPGMGPTRYISKNSVKRLDPEETKRRIKEKTERLGNFTSLFTLLPIFVLF